MAVDSPCDFGFSGIFENQYLTFSYEVAVCRCKNREVFMYRL